MLRRADPRFALRNAVTGQRVERCRNSPSLILDFINQDYRTGLGSYYERHSFSDLIALTRPGSGMRWNAEGNLELVSAGLPRFDHDPVTGQRLGLLVERQKTNLVTQSSASAATWGNAGGGGQVDLSLNRWGYFSGLRVESAGAGWNSATIPCDSVSSGTPYGVTFYVEEGTSGKRFFGFRDVASGNQSTLLGSFGSPMSVNSTAAGSITDVSEWDHPQGGTVVTAIWTPNFSGEAQLRIGPNSGVTGESIIALGAQMEFQFPSSFIPASGSTATRPQDLPDMGSFPLWFNPSQGSMIGGFGVYFGDNAYCVEITDGGSTGERLLLRFNGAGGAGSAAFSIDDGSTTSVYQANAEKALWQDHGLAYADGELIIARNGDSDSTSVASHPSGLDSLRFGSRHGTGAFDMNGHIRDFKYWPTRLSNAELEAITL